MKKIFTEVERLEYIDRIFLSIFREDKVDEEDLKLALCESYSDDENQYKSFEEIPVEYKMEAIEDTCTASGLKYDDFDDILNYFYNEFNN